MIYERRSWRQRKEKQRKQRIIACLIAVAVIILIGILLVMRGCSNNAPEEPEPQVTATPKPTPTIEPTPTPFAFHPVSGEQTKKISKSIVSKYGIVMDAEDGTILAQRRAKKKMYPASMTKVLTVLVAAEHITEQQLEDKVTITLDITDYCYRNDCSAVGFSKNEKVPVKDLFYGTILPSGADAALALAEYVAGSHEEFVKLMNEKAKELGISKSSHFTNCIGIYNDHHYSTVYDMAIIIKAASENPLCQEVMNARTYTTTKTKKHKKGILISNWFLRRIEDHFKTGDILYGKTGFVNQSGSCCASMAENSKGHTYICVTGGSTSSWQCIYDQINLYAKYCDKIKKTAN